MENENIKYTTIENIFQVLIEKTKIQLTGDPLFDIVKMSEQLE